tara:strand:- start:6568 stop:6849 length:282 start_codon:yes stop_codon:yes gene_type:complete
VFAVVDHITHVESVDVFCEGILAEIDTLLFVESVVSIEIEGVDEGDQKVKGSPLILSWVGFCKVVDLATIGGESQSWRPGLQVSLDIGQEGGL